MKKFLGSIVVMAVVFRMLFPASPASSPAPIVNIQENSFLNFYFWDWRGVSVESLWEIVLGFFGAVEEEEESFFTVQPSSCTVYEGDRLWFYVGFLGEPSRYICCWQYLPEGEDVWVDSQAVTAGENAICYLSTLAYNGRIYRCTVVDQETGMAYVSNSALLTVLAKG